jgi:hypothetical protein
MSMKIPLSASLATISQIRKIRLIFNLGITLQVLIKWTAWWLQAMAVFIIILKILSISFFKHYTYFILAFLPVLSGAIYYSSKKYFSNMDAASWLDLKSQAGGKIIALLSKKHSGDRIANKFFPLKKVNLSLNFLLPLKKLSLPVILFSVALLVPAAKTENQVSTIAIKQRAAIIAKHIEQSRQLNFISQEETEILEDELARAVKDINQAPEASYEAVDRVQEKIDNQILTMAKMYQKNLKEARNLVMETSKKGSKNFNKMAAILDNALESTKNSSEQLDPKLQNLLDNLDLKTGDLVALSKKLADMDLDKLQHLAKMLEEQQNKKLSSCGQCLTIMVSKEAKEYLCSILECNQCSSGVMAMTSGAVSRGPGDADLTFGSETDESAARFKPILLKKGDSLIPGVKISSKRLHVSKIEAVHSKPAAQTGTEVKTRTGGSSAGINLLSPYHKKVSARYFSEEKND